MFHPDVMPGSQQARDAASGWGNEPAARDMNGNIAAGRTPVGASRASTGGATAAGNAGWNSMPADYNPGQFSPPGAGGAQTSAGTMGEWSNLRSPNQIVARSYLAAPQAAQNMTTSAIANNTGITQADADAQIKAQLPKFQSPSFGLAEV